jgi:hypothetical protein
MKIKIQSVRNMTSFELDQTSKQIHLSGISSKADASVATGILRDQLAGVIARIVETKGLRIVPESAAGYIVSAAQRQARSSEDAESRRRRLIAGIEATLRVNASEAKFLAHMVLSRLESGANRQIAGETAPVAGPLLESNEPIGSLDELCEIFQYLVMPSIATFAREHFGESAEWSVRVAEDLTSESLGYLSDKTDEVGFSGLVHMFEAAREDGEGAVREFVSPKGSDRTDHPDMAASAELRMRNYLVFELMLPPQQSEEFLRRIRPCLDTVFAHCFARFMMRAED